MITAFPVPFEDQAFKKIVENLAQKLRDSKEFKGKEVTVVTGSLYEIKVSTRFFFKETVFESPGMMMCTLSNEAAKVIRKELPANMDVKVV